MSDLYWLRPGWKQARCARCGVTIWPDGDPDWGLCYNCFTDDLNRRHSEPEVPYPCDICGKRPAVTGVNGFGVCSQECANKATACALSGFGVYP
jgi:hypothetical protein